MNSRFFPEGGNGSNPDPRNDKCYQVKPGDIQPLFDAGLLRLYVENGRITHIKITDKGLDVIKKHNE